MFISRILVINSLILFGTIAVLIYNFSVFHEITIMTEDLNLIVNNIEEKKEEIKHYKEYEKALKVSGFEHKELVQWLNKYGDGRLNELMKETQESLLEENLLIGFISLKGLKLCREDRYIDLENHLVKYVRYVNDDNGNETERLQIFKEQVKKYFHENNIELRSK